MNGRQILVVEDEYIIADVVQRGLEGEGVIVIGPVPSVRQALRLLDTGTNLDGAVLNVNLRDEKVFPVAMRFRRKVPRSCSPPATILPGCRRPGGTFSDWKSRSSSPT